MIWHVTCDLLNLLATSCSLYHLGLAHIFFRPKKKSIASRKVELGFGIKPYSTNLAIWSVDPKDRGGLPNLSHLNRKK